MEEEKTENPNSNGFTDWEHLLSSSPPATTIHISDDPFLSIFPPVNHEGLPAASPLDDSHCFHRPSTSKESAVSTPSCRFYPSDSRAGDPSNQHRALDSHSPPPISPIGKWVVYAFQLLNSRTLSFLSTVHSRIMSSSLPPKSSVSVGGITTVASLMMLGIWIWWRRRSRRSRGGTEDTIERLNLLIKEKDEKIIELLNQVAELNKLLLARYRVPVVRDC